MAFESQDSFTTAQMERPSQLGQEAVRLLGEGQPWTLDRGSKPGSVQEPQVLDFDNAYSSATTGRAIASADRTSASAGGSSATADRSTQTETKTEYEVKDKDNLSRIAKHALRTDAHEPTGKEVAALVDQIVELNKDKYPQLLNNKNLIHPGMKLALPDSNKTASQKSSSAELSYRANPDSPGLQRVEYVPEDQGALPVPDLSNTPKRLDNVPSEPGMRANPECSSSLDHIENVPAQQGIRANPEGSSEPERIENVPAQQGIRANPEGSSEPERIENVPAQQGIRANPEDSADKPNPNEVVPERKQEVPVPDIDGPTVPNEDQSESELGSEPEESPVENPSELNQLLNPLIDSVGKSVQDLEPGIDSRVACAVAVSHVLHEVDPRIQRTNSNNVLERNLIAAGYERASLDDAQPGDVILGRRPNGMPGHAAIYLGQGAIFNNDSNSGVMQLDSVNKFAHGMHDSEGRFNKNGYSEVVVYRRSPQSKDSEAQAS